ncbi:hypothetical protein PHISCL_08832 [Aspergillus sclerotialis]|uniref:Uncharacterized protein n=1 Tax=Aspergillus sclerotialis TaxID=2070753 RepID=A0A3A2ZP23_9EURO|nr:hypothetical protein PHISCL_08832 [Aspergillus sclerotialis]
MQQLLSRMSLYRKEQLDLEKQVQISIQRMVHDKRIEFAQLLFGLKPGTLAHFPGIKSYCDYLEREAFQALMDPIFDPIRCLVPCSSSLQVEDCWDWCIAVLQVLRSAQPETSIHDILRHLEEKAKVSEYELNKRRDKSYLYLAIFAALCWTSMMVRPRLVFEDGMGPHLTCLLPDGVKQPKYSQNHRLADRYMRPVLTTFRSFKQLYWGERLDEHAYGISRDADSLYAASLSIYSLRYFGHVTIQWVDTISEHLRFNPANRRLSLFRFPSFCALLAVHSNETCPAVRSISEELDPLSPEDRDQCCVSLEQEVILSYRLLFGQDGISRKLAHEEIYALKQSRANQSVDTMLSDLCERKYKYGYLWWKSYDRVLRGYPPNVWPITCRSIEGHLQQSDVYSARDDFPRLGRRLIRLQQFNLRQRPSKLTDLWRDRRNPLQWYTFWAVVLVGGVANILAALQLLVSIIDLQTSV